MANPLKPKLVKVLEKVYKAHVISVVVAAKAGETDLVACYNGLFYAFEVKWKNDQPSELQKQKINSIIDAGGKAYFIRSVEQLHNIMENNIEPTKYPVKTIFKI